MSPQRNCLRFISTIKIKKKHSEFLDYIIGQFCSLANVFRVLFSFQCCWWDHQVRKTQMAIGSRLSPSWQKLRRKRHSFRWKCWPCPSARGPTEDQQDSDRILSPAVSRAESWRTFHKLEDPFIKRNAVPRATGIEKMAPLYIDLQGFVYWY